MGKGKVQFTLTFYFKQNKAVQLDLRFEIFIFLSLLPGLPPGKMLEQNLRYGFLRFGICVLIYINDQQKCIKYSKTYHFADDTSIMQSSLQILSKRIKTKTYNLSKYYLMSTCLGMNKFTKQN